jgi:hypothetical protein
MSPKKPRRSSVGRSKPKSAARRPVNTEIGMLVIDLGHGPAGTPSDIAKTLDREWFRSHPLRSHRLRRTIADEFPEKAGDWVLIRQLQPGVRQHLPFKALAQFPSGEAPEHIAHAMYDLFAEFRRAPIFMHEIIQRSRIYEIAGEDPSQDTPLRRH